MASIANMLGGGDAAGSSSGQFIPTLKQASSLVQQILRDVQSLDAALSSVVAKAGAVRGALGGMPGTTGAYAGAGLNFSGTPSMGTNFLPTVSFGGQPAPSGGATGGGGGGGGGPSRFGWGQAITAQAMASFFGGSSTQVQQATTDEVLFNRLRTLSAGSFSQRLGVSQLAGMYSANGKAGFIGNQDLTGAVGAGLNAGALNVASPGFAHALAVTSQLSNTTLAQTMGATLSASSNPMAVVRLQSMGVNTLNSQGMPNNPLTIASQLQRATGANYGSGASGARRVQADFSMYGPLRMALSAMGISNDDISQVYMPMFEASQQTGMSISSSSSFQKAASKAGFGSTRFGTSARDRATGQADMYGAQFNSMLKAAEVTDRAAASVSKFTSTVQTLMDVLGGSKGIAGALGLKQDGTGGAGGIVNSLAHDYFDYKVFKMLKGGGGGTGGLIGRLFGGGGGAAAADGGVAAAEGAAGAAGADGLLAGLGPPGWIAASALTLGVLGKRNTPVNLSTYKAPVHGYSRFGMTLGVNNVATPSGGAGMGATTGDSGASKGGAISASSLGSFASQYIGTPYSWGGGGINGPSSGMAQGAGTVGFDCSSFVQFVFAHFGVMLPRTTYDQVKVGVTVSPREAMAGDLLFFDGPPSAPGHVGIYLGNGNMIEAPHTGSSVRTRAVDPASAVIIKRVMNTTGSTTSNASSGTGSASGSLMGSLVSGALGRAQNLAGIAGDTSLSPSVAGGLSAILGGSGGGAASGGAGAAPSSVSGNAALGKQMAAAMGWTGGEWNSLYALWNRESGWNANAVNKSSGAAGIPQDITGNMHGGARGQIAWGLNYIKGRYGDPNAAWGHEKQVGWYDKGAWKIKGDQPAVVHTDEMILPKALADQVRTALTGGSGGGRGGCSVTLQVFPATADETAARRLATMVKDLLDHDNHINNIAVT